MPKNCSFDNCNNRVFSTGYCQSHWRSEIGSKKNYLSGSTNVSNRNISSNKISETKQAKLAHDIQDKKDMAAFFEAQIERIPRCCENCCNTFEWIPKWKLKWLMAHICPKATFESIKLEPGNLLFMCEQCHGNYDHKGQAHRRSMPVYALAVERIEKLYYLLTDHEQVLLTDYL